MPVFSKDCRFREILRPFSVVISLINLHVFLINVLFFTYALHIFYYVFEFFSYTCTFAFFFFSDKDKLF